MKKYNLYIIFIILFMSIGYCQIDTLRAEQAKEYVGDMKTVCGQVVSANYVQNSPTKPTFLNLDNAYPNHIFTIVIMETIRDSFNFPPEEYYLNKKICVSGLINIFKDKPQIIVTRPSQITVIP